MFTEMEDLDNCRKVEERGLLRDLTPDSPTTGKCKQKHPQGFVRVLKIK
jgi:hypothetical protein